jgi:predicted ATPase
MLMPKKLDYDCADKSKMPYTNELLGDVDPEETTDDTYAPEYFSSGFHQGAPILMQMDMMKMNEVLAVENPEVHLHPGLQLTFMGFFIENALIGKYSLIETHSDLMIRRVMRAIHEEKLPQSWVNVYFVDVEQVEGKKIRTSKIDRLWLNEQGAVSNWPKGFLNDDVREAEALMRSMYGMRIQAEDEDHE